MDDETFMELEQHWVYERKDDNVDDADVPTKEGSFFIWKTEDTSDFIIAAMPILMLNRTDIITEPFFSTYSSMYISMTQLSARGNFSIVIWLAFHAGSEHLKGVGKNLCL